jgi:FkbM family methyltransferase
MQYVKKIGATLLSMLTGNSVGQKILQTFVFYANYLMGVGSGASASSSGEAAILQDISHSGKSPLVIFDVGANKGQFLHLALQKNSSVGLEVHCFEPSKAAFDMLTKSFGNCTNVFLNNFGLAATEGTAPLYFDKPASGLASLTKRRLEHHGIANESVEIVKIDTLDAYCKAKDIKIINLLKIDVEGHELEVLKGARKMFDSLAIEAVTFEFGGCNIDTRTFFQDYWYFFCNLKMKLYRVTPSGYLHPIDAYKESSEQMTTTNFFAKRNL